jgi:hypothetical protein
MRREEIQYIPEGLALASRISCEIVLTINLHLMNIARNGDNVKCPFFALNSVRELWFRVLL